MTRAAAGATGPGRGRHSPAARASYWALNHLPWPWGREIMALAGVARGLASADRRARALRWAGEHRRGRWACWRLALSVLAGHGRLEAVNGLIGIPGPEALRRHVTVEGVDHLARASWERGVLLLGFHLGPARSWLVLRALGYRVTPFVSWGAGGWQQRPGWRAFLEDGDPVRPIATRGEDWAGALAAGRRALLAGEMVFIMADGIGGRPAFALPVPGGTVVARGGWLALRRHTGAVTLPVLSRLDGRRWIVRIHPPLPAVADDTAADIPACREAIAPIVADYVRRHPGQCRWLVFRGADAP